MFVTCHSHKKNSKSEFKKYFSTDRYESRYILQYIFLIIALVLTVLINIVLLLQFQQIKHTVYLFALTELTCLQLLILVMYLLKGAKNLLHKYNEKHLTEVCKLLKSVSDYHREYEEYLNISEDSGKIDLFTAKIPVIDKVEEDRVDSMWMGNFFLKNYFKKLCSLKVDTLERCRYIDKFAFSLDHKVMRYMYITGEPMYRIKFITSFILTNYRRNNIGELVVVTQNSDFWTGIETSFKNSFINTKNSSYLILESHILLEDVLKNYYAKHYHHTVLLVIDINVVLPNDYISSLFANYDIFVIDMRHGRYLKTVKDKISILIKEKSIELQKLDSEDHVYSKISLESLEELDGKKIKTSSQYKNLSLDGLITELLSKDKTVFDKRPILSEMCTRLRRKRRKTTAHTCFVDQRDFIVNQIIGDTIISKHGFYTLILDFNSSFSYLENTRFTKFFTLLNVSEDGFSFHVISSYIHGEISKRYTKLEEYGYTDIASYNISVGEDIERDILLVISVDKLQNQEIVNLIRLMKNDGEKIGFSILLFSRDYAGYKANSDIFDEKHLFTEKNMSDNMLSMYRYRGEYIGFNKIYVDTDNIEFSIEEKIEIRDKLYDFLDIRSQIDQFSVSNNRDFDWLSQMKNKLTLRELLVIDEEGNGTMSETIVEEYYADYLICPIGVISDYFSNVHSILMVDLEYNDAVFFDTLRDNIPVLLQTFMLSFLYTHPSPGATITLISNDKNLYSQLVFLNKIFVKHDIHFLQLDKVMSLKPSVKNDSKNIFILDIPSMPIGLNDSINMIDYLIIDLKYKGVIVTDNKHTDRQLYSAMLSKGYRYDYFEIDAETETSIEAKLNQKRCNIALPQLINMGQKSDDQIATKSLSEIKKFIV